LLAPHPTLDQHTRQGGLTVSDSFAPSSLRRGPNPSNPLPASHTRPETRGPCHRRDKNRTNARKGTAVSPSHLPLASRACSWLLGERLPWACGVSPETCRRFRSAETEFLSRSQSIAPQKSQKHGGAGRWTSSGGTKRQTRSSSFGEAARWITWTIWAQHRDARRRSKDRSEKGGNLD